MGANESDLYEEFADT